MKASEIRKLRKETIGNGFYEMDAYSIESLILETLLSILEILEKKGKK